MSMARDYLRSLLDGYGLGSLADWAWNLMQQGVTDDEVIQQLRTRPEYKARFAGMEQRRSRGLPAVSENEYLALERQYLQAMRNAGLPESFYDQPSDFAAFIGQDVSVNEMTQRVNLARDAVYTAPQETRDQLRAWGLTEGDLTAYWLDPDRALPLLERKFQSAQTSGIAQRSGYGALTEAEANRLTQVGVTGEQAAQGFTDLASHRELFNALDRGETQLGRDTQLGAAFEGDAAAKTAVENRGRRRAAAFAGNGSFAGTQAGYGGLG